jgi:hypothetical protein
MSRLREAGLMPIISIKDLKYMKQTANFSIHNGVGKDGEEYS